MIGPARLLPFALASLFVAMPALGIEVGKKRPAKLVFGAIKTPLPGPAVSIGRYNLGCIAGAKQLPATGETWQAMRLSRNRTYGHPALLKFIEKLANDAHRLEGWPGLLVGDMGQPIGGPMVTGHASHQIGLDVDIWLKPMPDHELSPQEREELQPDNVVDKPAWALNALWTPKHAALLKRAVSYPEVARIFVNPVIKKALCDGAGSDRAWLRKVRPWWGHDDHFHVRLNCQPGSPACVNQPPEPPGDGCGKELNKWLALLKRPAGPPGKPKPPVPLSALPKQCQNLVARAEQLAAKPGF